MSIRAWHGVALALIILCCLACAQKEETGAGNRLALASSPYLREHADNPVDWFEWGSEALEKASKENKPILISIGYAACHWCHVMEEETFMDTAVARMMNKNFVSIKIDREERPDIDQIYINASQLITGHAGWPLNAFALPDGKPFYAGTYFPNGEWKDLLGQITKAYQSDFENLRLQANEVAQGIVTSDVIKPGSNNTTQLKRTSEIFSQWESAIDFDMGGLQGAPKFPMPVVWEFLLRENYYSKNTKSLQAVNITLDAMARGGIYDHLAGGFARYATDGQWKVPHFEKMLYDNGQLASLYAHAFQVTKNPAYARVVKETLEFVTQELTAPQGGFYSSLNADSEGEEGAFYVWTANEIEKILGPASTPLREHFNITDAGNWEAGKNILYKTGSRKEITDAPSQEDDVPKLIAESMRKLLEVRNKRVRPSLDDKILTSWNALMITGYVDAYWALGDEAYLNTALQNAKFIEVNMLNETGHLFRSYSHDKATIDGFLDDYALLAQAFIQLYQATFDVQWLQDSKKITDYALLHFQDSATGFFFYTSDESQQLIARKMEIPDQVIPASNSVMAEVLLKLGAYYGNDSYVKASRAMLENLGDDIFENGPYYARWASVVGLVSNQPFEVAIIGPDAKQKSKALMKDFLPDVLLLGGKEENLPLLENKLVPGKTIIYVCRNKVCKLPVLDVKEALQQLK